MDPNSLYTDPNSPIGDLYQATFNRRNALLSSLKGEYDKNYYGATFGAGADAAAAARRESLGGVRSALAARGLSGSGAEAAANRGIANTYQQGLLASAANAGQTEDQRKQALLNQMNSLYGQDVSLLGSIAGGQLSAEAQAVKKALGQYQGSLAWTDAVGGLTSIATILAGAYAGAGSTDTTGMTSAQAANANRAGAMQGAQFGSTIAGMRAPNDYSYQTSGLDMYGRPTGGTVTYGPLDSTAGPGMRISVPASADSALQAALRSSGYLNQ